MKLDWWAIVLSYVLLAGITVGAGITSDKWDTISYMVAQDTKTRNAFSLIAGVTLLCQGYWLQSQVRQWMQLANGPNVWVDGVMPAIQVRSRYEALQEFPFVTALISIGAVACTVGTVGLVVWSQNLDADNHLRYAAVMFVGTLMYELGVIALYVFIPLPHDLRQHVSLARFFWIISVGHLIGLSASNSYWPEYVLVTSLHGCALSLTLPDAKVPRSLVMVSRF